MPLSASKSSSKRKISASAAKQLSSVDSRKKNPLQRSKSVSAVTRSYIETPVAPVAGDPSVAQFLNKRDNPLFCCSSPSSSEHEGGGVGCNTRRGRSLSRSFGYGNRASESRNRSTGSLSRVGSEGRQRAISRVHYDYSEREEDGVCKDILSLKSETKDTHDPKFQKNKGMASNSYGMLEQRKNLQTWRSPVSDYCNTSSSRSWEDGISVSSFSELEETTIREHDHPSTRGGVGCIYEIVRSEVQWAVSEMKNDLENVLRRLGTNVYLLDLQSSVGTSPISNIADLIAYDGKRTDTIEFETLPISQSIVPVKDQIDDVIDIRTMKTRRSPPLPGSLARQTIDRLFLDGCRGAATLLPRHTPTSHRSFFIRR